MYSEQDTLHSAEACYQRGTLLRAQQRHSDAASMFQRALEADASHAPSYAMLALCWIREEDKAAQAVDAAGRAVALEPEDSHYRSVLALAIAASAKMGQNGVLREALASARQAVELDSDSSFAHAVEASLQLRLGKYPDAEAAARRALALDTENEWASEVLSIALLQQHKDEDNAGLIKYQLETRPNDDSSHTSAGWLALRKGRHQEANKHFMEALRLNPMNEGARLGLVESFRARSFVYSAYVRFAHGMSRFSDGAQTGIMIGGFVAYRLLQGYLSKVAPFWVPVLVGAWLLLALWSHLARGFGSFFMVFDKFARRALKPAEMWEGVAVGGSTVLALGFLALSFTAGKEAAEVALVLFLSAVVSAAAFTNDHHLGKYLYGTAAVAAGVGALVTVVALLVPINPGIAGLAFLTSVVLGVAVSWLRPLRFFYA